eukprot:6208699-Pleurochrysis_carterae.AAC.4
MLVFSESGDSTAGDATEWIPDESKIESFSIDPAASCPSAAQHFQRLKRVNANRRFAPPSLAPSADLLRGACETALIFSPAC